MADRPIVRVTTNEILKYRVPHTNEDIYYDLWADANDLSRNCIRCDLCQRPLVLAGTPGKRLWGNLDRHRGTPACTDRQRANQRASALEAERRHRAEASAALNLISGRFDFTSAFGAHRRSDSILSSTASGPSTSRSTPAISITPVATGSAGNEIGVPTPEPPATRVPSPSPNSEASSPLPDSDLANSVHLLSDGEPESPPIAPYELDGPDYALEEFPSLDIPDSEDGASTCQGQLIEWTPGSVWMTYNFTYHANPRIDLPWTPHSADKDGRWIRLQSRECVLRLRDGAEKESRTCKKCCRIANHPRLHEIMERASLPDLPKSTEHSHLNPLQMSRLAKRLAKQVQQLKSEKYNLKRRLQTARSKINQYDQILVFISQNNLRSASRVLHRSLKRGDGLATTLDKLVASANGKGKERAVWSEEDLDIANLVRLEGGPRLLYALSKSEGFASRTTLQRRRPIPEILPSVGTPTRAEIDANISSMLCERARPAPEYLKAGVVLMIDDVALEEVPRYDAARNCVVY